MTATGQSRPVLLFVHGAWHGSWCWEFLRQHMEADGWTTRALDLPSVTRSGDHAGLLDDAEVVNRAIDDIGAPVVVVAHSYGGMAVTQGAADNPHVQHIVYLAAFMLREGQSVLSAVGGQVPAWWDVEDGTVTPRRPHEVFFNDVPSDVAERAATRLRPQSMNAFTDELSAAAWRTIRSTYVVCDQDQAIPPAAQAAMSGAADAVHHLSSGHSAYLSRTTELAAIVAAIADPQPGP